MGREIKRVALNFEWPIKRVWDGYCNPYHPTTCWWCEGSGLNVESKSIFEEWCYGEWMTRTT